MEKIYYTLEDLVRYTCVKWERNADVDVEEVIEELYPQFKKVLPKKTYITTIVDLFFKGSDKYVVECLDNNDKANLTKEVMKVIQEYIQTK